MKIKDEKETIWVINSKTMKAQKLSEEEIKNMFSENCNPTMLFHTFEKFKKVIE